MKKEISEELFKRAEKVIPGGVNSPVRAFKSVGGNPLFIEKAEGALVTDVDGNEFIDYLASWGPLIFGHAHPRIIEAVNKYARLGTSFGAPTELEVILAEMLVEAVPCMETVRTVSSGTEAVMSAVRLSRGHTGREQIVKFEGCYHGHGDSLLVKAGSGVASLGLPECPGIVSDLAKNTITLPYNDLEKVQDLFTEMGDEIACLIVEPIAGNMGVIPPQPGFLELLRDVTYKHGTILIFDEVITGFRVGYGGAQKLYDIMPDLTCLGKIIGGGLPVGAYGGKRKIMDGIAPVGAVYQAGTLAGNPLTVAAGLVTLRRIEADPGLYNRLEEAGAELESRLSAALKRHRMDGTIQRVGAMLTVFFGPSRVRSWDDTKTIDRDRFARFFHAAMSRGVVLPPSPFEALFIMDAHTDVMDSAAVALESAIGDAV